MLFCTWVKNSSSLRSLYLPLRSRQDLTATLRFRSSCPLRSHTEVYLAVILDKSRCVNRFCNRKCSLVASFHFTQIFSISEKFPALFRSASLHSTRGIFRVKKLRKVAMLYVIFYLPLRLSRCRFALPCKARAISVQKASGYAGNV